MKSLGSALLLIPWSKNDLAFLENGHGKNLTLHVKTEHMEEKIVNFLLNHNLNGKKIGTHLVKEKKYIIIEN